jgi:hypothetical protein
LPQPLASGSEGTCEHSPVLSTPSLPGEIEGSAQPSSASVLPRVKAEGTREVQPPRHLKKVHAGEPARTNIASSAAFRVKPEPQDEAATFALLREPVTSPGESAKRSTQHARDDDDGTGDRGSGKRRRTERQSVLGLGREVMMLRPSAETSSTPSTSREPTVVVKCEPGVKLEPVVIVKPEPVDGFLPPTGDMMVDRKPLKSEVHRESGQGMRCFDPRISAHRSDRIQAELFGRSLLPSRSRSRAPSWSYPLRTPTGYHVRL